jgi:hypothetical protein
VNAFLAIFGAFLKGFGDVFLGWLRDRRAEQAYQDLGASKERERISDEVASAQRRASDVVARRDDDGLGARRLQDGQF